MSFFNSDLDSFLKAAIPKRFQDISPYEFEDFMAFLFEENSYQVEQTDYSADFGADLIVEKHGNRIAVQIKRYAETTKVGVHDINQIIGAGSYYGTDEVMLITCSSLTRSGKKLAEETGVITWEWEDLLLLIQDTFFNGKDYFAYFSTTEKVQGGFDFNFEVTSIEYSQKTHKGEQSIVVIGELTNNSNQNIFLKLLKPIYIGSDNRQYSAVDWVQDYFTEGLVFSDSRVELAFIYLPRQIEKFSKGDRIILHLLNKEGIELKVLEHRIKKAENSCFIVSYCYGRNSVEYQYFIQFRENFLKSSIPGRKLIQKYYALSPSLVGHAKSNKIFRFCIRLFIILILYIIKLFNISRIVIHK